MDSFFNRCVRPFEQLIQTCGHNRARQRDKVAHLLEEFAMLQDEVSLGVAEQEFTSYQWLTRVDVEK